MGVFHLINKRVFDISLFRVLVVAFASINMIPLFNDLFLSRVLYAVFAVWALLLMVYKTFILKTLLKPKYSVLLFVFFLFAGISILVNYKNGFSRNVMTIYMPVVFAFLLYVPDTGKGLMREVRIVSGFFIGFTFLVSAASFVMYMFQISFTFLNRNGVNIRQGFLENRLFGLYISPNVGVVFALTSILLTSICIFFVCKKPIKKVVLVFYWFNILLQYLYFLLANSRGGMVAASAAIALLIVFGRYEFMVFRIRFKVETVLSKIVCLILVFGTLFLVAAPVKYGLAYVPMVTEKVFHLNNPNMNGETGETDFTRIEADSEDISNGRTVIWSAAYHLWRYNPFVGVANADVIEEDTENSYVPTDTLSKEKVFWLNRANGNMHNVFIQIGVNYGTVALFSILLFLLLIFIFVFRKMMSQRKKGEMCNLELMLLAIAAFYLCHNIFETYLFVWGSNVFGALFWLFLGYAIFFLENGPSLAEKNEEIV